MRWKAASSTPASGAYPYSTQPTEEDGNTAEELASADDDTPAELALDAGWEAEDAAWELLTPADEGGAALEDSSSETAPLVADEEPAITADDDTLPEDDDAALVMHWPLIHWPFCAWHCCALQVSGLVSGDVVHPARSARNAALNRRGLQDSMRAAWRETRVSSRESHGQADPRHTLKVRHS